MTWLLAILTITLVAVGIDDYLQRRDLARMERWARTWRRRSGHE